MRFQNGETVDILKKINNRKTKKFFDAENNFLFLDIDTIEKDKFRGNERILIKERLRRKLERKNGIIRVNYRCHSKRWKMKS